MQPTVSVIVPVYNAKAYLDDTLRSVEAQTYSGPIELSAYDDGSSDGSWDMLQAFQSKLKSDPRLSVTLGSAAALGVPGRRGPGFARNHAVQQVCLRALVSTAYPHLHIA